MIDADALRRYLESALSDETFFIDTLLTQKAGKRTLLTIALDSVTPMTLDDIARASRVIDGILEETDIVGENPYTLEVTSRGVDAPLLKPHHFIQNIGRLVALTTHPEGERIVRIQDANEESLTTEDGSLIEYSAIESAFVQIEFNRKQSDEN